MEHAYGAVIIAHYSDRRMAVLGCMARVSIDLTGERIALAKGDVKDISGAESVKSSLWRILMITDELFTIDIVESSAS